MRLRHGFGNGVAQDRIGGGSEASTDGRATANTAHTAGKKRRRGESSAEEGEPTREELVEMLHEERQWREELEEKLKKTEGRVGMLLEILAESVGES